LNQNYRLVRRADGRTIAVAETARGAGKGRGAGGATSLKAGRGARALWTTVLAFGTACSAHAADWTGGDGDWFEATSWSGGAVPDANQRFRIDNGSTVRIQAANAVARSGPPEDPTAIGNSAAGRLEISNGGTLDVSGDRALYLGFSSGSSGRLTVSGPTSALTFNDGSLIFGSGGTGTMEVSAGGTVTSRSGAIGSNTGGAGTVTVRGIGSTWQLTTNLEMSAGTASTANLEISAGATVTSGGVAIIGDRGAGTATVSGTGSAMHANGIWVGSAGSGSLSISDGGSVTSILAVTIGALTNGRGILNIGDGGAAGLVSAPSISGGSGGGTVNFNHTDTDYHFTSDGTSSGTVNVLSGNLNVTVAGGGKTTLAGNNSYTGGTMLNAGTLGVGHNNALGTGRLTMAANTTLQHAGSTSLTLGNAITLNGAAVIDVADTNFSLTLQGSMSGSGGLTKTGGSTLYLSGAGSNYTGATNINAGAIWSGTDNSLSPASDFTVASGAILLAGGSQAIGSLAGGGMAWGGILGASTLTTGGSGATTTFSGNLSDGWGTLALVKTGSGTMTLSGANTHTGGTTVNGGTLAVNGSIVGNTTVNNGGALGGSGTVGTVTVASGGALAPGNSIGTLTVAGNLSFAPGSIYRVEVDAAGAADRVNATGNITINGGTVDVQAGGGTYQRNTRYTILNSGGTTTGQFASVTTNLAFLTPSLIYEANGVLLDLQSTRYTGVAQTSNQAAVANHLQSFAASPGNAQAATLIQQVDNLTAEQARTAFDSLAGSAHASGSQAALAIGRDFSSVLGGRTGFSTGGLVNTANAAAQRNRTLYASADRYDPTITSDTVAQGVAPRALDANEAASERGLWAQTLGSGGRIDTDGNAAGSRYRSNGLVFGYDQPVADRWVAGAAAGYSRSGWNTTSGSAASGKIESPQAGVYARYAGEEWRLRVDGTLASHSFTTDRTVTIGAASSTAHSKHSGREWSLGAQAETTIQFGDWQLKPVAGVRHTQLKESGFTETGSGPGNLTVAARTSQSTLLSAGMHFARAINDGKGQLELRAVASHLAGDVDSPVTASIAGQAGSFTANGVPLKRNALALGATATGQLARNVNAYLDANYELRGAGQSAYRLTAGMRVAF
jgi:outer membrane autotransporter protein